MISKGCQSQGHSRMHTNVFANSMFCFQSAECSFDWAVAQSSNMRKCLTVRLLRNRPNAFYNFTMGNRPKMSLKYAIFKICPKLARKWYSCETRVYSTIFGDSWRQKVVSVFGFGHPKSHFFAPKITENGRFWVQKNWTVCFIISCHFERMCQRHAAPSLLARSGGE